jgi:hypothetical protein
MKEKNYINIIILLVGLILWILFLCDAEMSRYGMYSIFSYNIHELLAMVPSLCILITLCWLIFIIVKSITNKDIKSNIVLTILLLVLCAIQIIYINNRSNISYVSCVACIESVNEQKMEIVIKTDMDTLTLDCPMLVQYLIKADGTKYGISYEWNKSKPCYGKLCSIQAIN